MEEKEAKINVYLTGIGFHANVYRIMETYEGGYNVGKLPVPLDDSGALSVRLKPQSAAVYVCNDEDPVIYCTSLNWD
jgi:hypothetical protein